MSLLSRLIAAGTPADLVAEVARELARAEVTQEAIEQRRFKDRERQQRRREALNEQNMNHVMSRDTADVTPNASLSRPPNEINSNPPTHTHEKQTPRARKGTRLPAEWKPKPLPDALVAAVAHWPPGSAERELDRFRDWAASATGPNAIKSDWDAAWRNWIRKIEDEGRHGNANNRSSTGPGNVRAFSKPKDGAIAALDRRLGLDGSPGSNPSYDTGSGEADCGRAATGARRLFS